MVLLGILLALIVLDALYCSLRKRKCVRASEHQYVSTPVGGVQPATNRSINKGLISFATARMNDLTFLLFKVVGYIPSHIIRLFFYRVVFRMTVAKKVVIHYGLEARNPWNIFIGQGTIVGDKAILDARYGIEMGANVNLSTGVQMWTLEHDVNSPTFSSDGTGNGIVIGDRAWISSRTTILPGSRIAEGCVVASGAVVTKSIQKPYEIWGGVPAKKIGERNSDLSYEFNGVHRWFV